MQPGSIKQRLCGPSTQQQLQPVLCGLLGLLMLAVLLLAWQPGRPQQALVKVSAARAVKAFYDSTVTALDAAIDLAGYSTSSTALTAGCTPLTRRDPNQPAATAPAPAAIASSGTMHGRDCPPVLEGWQATCPKAERAHAYINGSTVTWRTADILEITQRWGNMLSPYWAARAVSSLAGYGFESEGFPSDWLQHLPKRLPPTTCARPALLEEVCSLCAGDQWLYAHACAGAWTHIRPTIMHDTHAAFDAWAHASNFSKPAFQPGDVVVHSRCAEDTLLHHPEYGPIAFSYYDNIPASTTAVYIVADLQQTTQECKQLQRAMQQHIQARLPAANVSVVGGSQHEDFARLLHAPLLFKDASSSFGLWAALANSEGEVWSTPLTEALSAHNVSPFLGVKWRWSLAPVLYPHVAQRLNLTIENFDKVLEWLKAN